jgi:PIN domain nuclease of toxin-antitoxin system
VRCRFRCRLGPGSCQALRSSHAGEPFQRRASRRLPVPLDELSPAAEDMGFVELPVRSAHAVHVARLPLHHRDPFDRLLVAQAILEPARLLTVDGPLRQYSDLVDIVTA